MFTMVEIAVTVVSTAVAVGALVVSYLTHRHQVRRARAIDVQERQVAEQARLMEGRERAAERRGALVQASMLDVRVTAVPSQLDPRWAVRTLQLGNGSSQPLSDLAATFEGAPLPEVSGVLAAGSRRTFALPQTGWDGSAPAELPVVEFSDAAGLRWRREPHGALRQGLRTVTEWRWGLVEAPEITQAVVFGQQPGGPLQPAPEELDDVVQADDAPPPFPVQPLVSAAVGLVGLAGTAYGIVLLTR